MKGNLPHHTHFIGIPVPTDLEDTIFECRNYMHEVYGCKSGYGTPPHITLIAPFSLPENLDDNDVLDALSAAMTQAFVQGAFPFEVKISGFGCFSDRTLFAHVEDSNCWQKIYSIFSKAFTQKIPGCIKRTDRKFYPHLSVANRDIPTSAMNKVLKHFAELNLNETFIAEEIAIYTRTLTGGWQEWRRVGE